MDLDVNITPPTDASACYRLLFNLQVDNRVFPAISQIIAFILLRRYLFHAMLKLCIRKTSVVTASAGTGSRIRCRPQARNLEALLEDDWLAVKA